MENNNSMQLDFNKVLSKTIALEYKVIIATQISTLVEDNIQALHSVTSLQRIQRDLLQTLLNNEEFLHLQEVLDLLPHHNLLSNLTAAKIAQLNKRITVTDAKVTQLESLIAYLDNIMESFDA